mgnify:CR=1 FL=1
MGEHAAARGFAAWTDRRGYEWDAPELDAGSSLSGLFARYVDEVERGVAGLDQAEPTAVRVFTRSVVGALEVA